MEDRLSIFFGQLSDGGTLAEAVREEIGEKSGLVSKRKQTNCRVSGEGYVHPDTSEELAVTDPKIGIIWCDKCQVGW